MLYGDVVHLLRRLAKLQTALYSGRLEVMGSCLGTRGAVWKAKLQDVNARCVRAAQSFDSIDSD